VLNKKLVNQLLYNCLNQNLMSECGTHGESGVCNLIYSATGVRCIEQGGGCMSVSKVRVHTWPLFSGSYHLSIPITQTSLSETNALKNVQDGFSTYLSFTNYKPQM
jgi:hypothetical protein